MHTNTYMNTNDNRLIWIDLEMTGLDSDNDKVIEIATVVTDAHLNVIAEGPEFAIYQPDEILALMDEWNVRQHGASGLIDRVKESKVTETEAEARTLEFLRCHVSAGVSPMAGNSVCQDRRFLHRYMPQLEQYFHYRNLDVSTIKELMKRWAPQLMTGAKKESRHRALDDVYDSIEELRYYREHFFKVL